MWTGAEDLAMLALAVALDLSVGEPPARFHPTVWMGRTVDIAAKLAPARGRAGILAGAVMTLAVAALWTGAAYFALWGLRELHTLAYLFVGALLLKTTFSLRMLHRAAAEVRRRVEADDLARARQGLKSLVSRDTSRLSREQTVGAAVESVSENLSDSFVGPWLFFAVFGLPGAVAYRAVNTLDSMVGYRGEFEFLGKASAKLDDLLNLIPGRVSALLLVFGTAVLPGQQTVGAWRIMWRDHSRTQSPNAGWAMSGMAGALGVELDKAGHYRLGDSNRPIVPHDITQAIRSMYAVALLGLAAALALTYARTIIAGL